MQGPPTPTSTEEDEASIPPEHVRSSPNMNRAFTEHRRAAKRTLPWDLPADELELVSPPQAEHSQATKRPRLEKPFSASTEATTENTAYDTTVALPSPDAAPDTAKNNIDSDSVTDTQPNAGANRATRRLWTLEEDAKLTRAVAKNPKKKYGKEYRTDWVAISELVPARTKNQCWHRWRDALEPRVDETPARTCRWTPDEDDKLMDAVQMHVRNDWDAIARLVPGRTRCQCCNRWRNVLDPRVDRTPGRTSNWTPDVDDKLKDAVQMHNGKNWYAIACLVPGRTIHQCNSRWHRHLDPRTRSAQTTGHPGKWTTDEDAKLKDAVQTHNNKNWDAITRLVPGRTKLQCRNRYRKIRYRK
jgi:hypothetical protein